jgi:tRNA 2-thiouridine synthesizing protein A
MQPNADSSTADAVLDLGETACGSLIMQIFERVGSLRPGQILEVRAYDRGALEDVPAWCRMTGHLLLRADASPQGGPARFLIQKKSA